MISLACPDPGTEGHQALRAVYRGEASPGQQRLALEVIVKHFAQPQDLLFIPGKPDETAFLNGRAFVATKIRHYVNAPIKNEDEHE